MSRLYAHERRSRSRARLAAVSAWALCAVLALPAAASQVFHSPGDDGAPAAGTPTIAEGGVQSVYLYVDGGAFPSSVGTACNVGVGDEVCGYSITLTALGGLTLNAFNADGGADVVANQTSGQIVINGLDPVSPSTGPQRIGELLVTAASGGSIDLASGEVIGADLTSETLASETVVTVPEPSAALAWASGLTLLTALARRRAQR